MAFLLWFLGWRDVNIFGHFLEGRPLRGSSQVKKDLPFMGIFLDVDRLLTIS